MENVKNIHAINEKLQHGVTRGKRMKNNDSSHHARRGDLRITPEKKALTR
jgi:hypothetical protein